jgi:nicotinate-nucleotide adenylyltransferase
VKIAILGGTFDPIHNGHLRAAQVVADTFEVDEVHFIPTFIPPHKSRSGVTSPFHRFAMVALAVAPFERFRVSSIEVDTLECRYSVDTLELMHRTYPGARFLFITGTDAYQEVDEWKDHRRLMELTDFAVVNRHGFPMRSDIAPVVVADGSSSISIGTDRHVYYLPSVNEDISSTEIREGARKGIGLGDWVPPLVLTYATKHRLYA